MNIKTRTLYLKNGKRVTRHSYSTNRKFLSAIRACLAEKKRVVVTYTDDKNEFEEIPINDSGYYTNKAELLKTARAFLQ